MLVFFTGIMPAMCHSLCIHCVCACVRARVRVCACVCACVRAGGWVRAVCGLCKSFTCILPVVEAVGDLYCAVAFSLLPALRRAVIPNAARSYPPPLVLPRPLSFPRGGWGTITW